MFDLALIGKLYYFRCCCIPASFEIFVLGEPELIFRQKTVYDDTIRPFFPTTNEKNVEK
jgi:hypothetical protein